MDELLCKQETYDIIGKCMEVHKILGAGFSEIIYKDALEVEFHLSDIFFEREKEYHVDYKSETLKHKFYADFVVYGKIILEVKAVKDFDDFHLAQCLNYLKVSGNRIALLVNFGESQLKYKRLIY